MRVWPRHKRFGRSASSAVVLLAGCSPAAPRRPRRRPPPRRPRRPPRRPRGWSEVTVAGTRRTWRSAPFDEPRQALVPDGLDPVGVGPDSQAAARGVGPRRRAAGIGAEHGTGGAACSPVAPGRANRSCSSGLDQPHGLAFAGSTLYVAESDQVDAYDYADGAATNRRTVAGGLPDANSPDLGGAYAHALKSVAVGPDGAVYFSIGSTGNISAEDRDGEPAAGDHHARPARRRTGPAVRHRRPQRHRAGRRARRFGVDGGQQSRQRRLSRPGPVVRPGGPRLRRRPPARVGRAADARPRIGLALLQSRRRTGRTCPSSATSRPTPTAASSTAPRCRPSSRASARTPRRWG